VPATSNLTPFPAMQIRTIAVTVPAPRGTVFHLLADIENLPRWAGSYCERIGLERGRWWALTTEGEQVLELEAHAAAGVVDLRAGPAPDRLTPTPLRVLALSARRTLVTLTVVETPDQSVEAYERRYQLWREVAEGLRRRFSGGEIHGAETAQRFAELGLN